MPTLTVSVPQNVKEYIEEQGAEEEFADAGEFLAELVRRDQERRLEELRRHVDEGLNGGVSTRTWQERVAEGDRIARERGLLGD